MLPAGVETKAPSPTNFLINSLCLDFKSTVSSSNKLYSSNYVNVIKLNKPLMVKIDGINGKGVIIKSDINIDSMDENESTGI